MKKTILVLLSIIYFFAFGVSLADEQLYSDLSGKWELHSLETDGYTFPPELINASASLFMEINNTVTFNISVDDQVSTMTGSWKVNNNMIEFDFGANEEAIGKTKGYLNKKYLYIEQQSFGELKMRFCKVDPENDDIDYEELNTKPSKQQVEEKQTVTHYIWNTKHYHCCDLEVKNISGSTADFRAQVQFYDKNNELVGVANEETDCIEVGSDGLIHCECDEPFDYASYTVSRYKSSHKAVQSGIDLQKTMKKNKVILVAKNKLSNPVRFLKYQCLFFDSNENAIGYAWGFLVDNDDELKPGYTEMCEETTPKGCKDVKVYITGWND